MKIKNWAFSDTVELVSVRVVRADPHIPFGFDVVRQRFNSLFGHQRFKADVRKILTVLGRRRSQVDRAETFEFREHGVINTRFDLPLARVKDDLPGTCLRHHHHTIDGFLPIRRQKVDTDHRSIPAHVMAVKPLEKILARHDSPPTGPNRHETTP